MIKRAFVDLLTIICAMLLHTRRCHHNTCSNVRAESCDSWISPPFTTCTDRRAVRKGGGKWGYRSHFLVLASGISKAEIRRKGAARWNILTSWTVSENEETNDTLIRWIPSSHFYFATKLKNAKRIDESGCDSAVTLRNLGNLFINTWVMRDVRVVISVGEESVVSSISGSQVEIIMCLSCDISY